MKQWNRYEDLAQVLSYPWAKEPLHASVARLGEHGRALAALDNFVSGSALGQVQEEYVASFDLNPSCAPYLGWHLFGGDERLRAQYLIRLKELYRAHGFEAPQTEPADHLPAVLRFVAHLGRREGEQGVRSFLDEYVLEGVGRLLERARARQGFPWQGALAALSALCGSQCEEVQ